MLVDSTLPLAHPQGAEYIGRHSSRPYLMIGYHK
jgi:hypothetical protein